ncbi:MAG: 4Fe-4S dicluster domain-containing protein [Anaerolineales bacterium]|jgi:ferredoxin
MMIDQLTSNILFALGSLIFLIFSSFGIISINEGERRAAKRTFGIAVAGFLATLGMAYLPLGIKLALLLGLMMLLLIGAIYLLLPLGRIDPASDIPQSRYDERDIMFARANLIPGTPEYQSYYAMRPENKGVDDTTRSKPGLLSPDAKYANLTLFASPVGSFTVTEALHPVVNGPVAAVRQTLPAGDSSTYVKNLATYFGALEVGITELKPYHVYTHIGRGSGIYGTAIEVKHQFAIVFTVEMDFEMMGASPYPPTVMESARQYVEAGRVAVQLAAAIRHLGYPARAHIDGNYRLITPLVARDAGLGEIGRMGLVMTAHQGPRVRLAVVTTDLPLIPDQRQNDGSMIDFCTVCKKCARACPSKSIPFDDRQEIDGALRWQINAETCFRYWNVIGTDCGRCVAVCPYSHPNTISHNIIRWGASKSGGFRRLAVWLDDFFYGQIPSPRRWPEWILIGDEHNSPET